MRAAFSASSSARSVSERRTWSAEVYDILAGLPHREGRLWPVKTIRAAFERAVEAAKLDAEFRFHDTRHHFASWFVMRGGGISALKEILGHRTLSMTMKYAHLSQDHLRAEVEKTEGRRQNQHMVSTNEVESPATSRKSLMSR
jgi:site-specific recombinase XerD